jgi:hypothetical protein
MRYPRTEIPGTPNRYQNSTFALDSRAYHAHPDAILPGTPGPPGNPGDLARDVTIETVPDKLPGKNEVPGGEQVQATDGALGHVLVSPWPGRATTSSGDPASTTHGRQWPRRSSSPSGGHPHQHDWAADRAPRQAIQTMAKAP